MATYQLQTPTGRAFALTIASDGTRLVCAHYHKRELLALAVSLEASVERARDLGNSVDQRQFESLRDLFLGALHHDS